MVQERRLEWHRTLGDSEFFSLRQPFDDDRSRETETRWHDVSNEISILRDRIARLESIQVSIAGTQQSFDARNDEQAKSGSASEAQVSKLKDDNWKLAPIRIPELRPQAKLSPSDGPCAGRANARDVGKECLKQILREVGCTGELPPEGYSSWHKARSYDELVKDSVLVSQTFNYERLGFCRGLKRDPSWPDLHSQVGQDFYTLARFQKRGFYVDIGAHHGNFMSNTRALQDAGWKGICVEPLPFDRFAWRDCTLVAAAIVPTAPASGFVTFQNCEDGQGVSGHSRLAAVKNTDSHACRSQEVKALTWRTLFQSHLHLLPANRVIEFLGLDCEGCELSLIEKFPFEHVCVELWVIENGPINQAGNTNPNYSLLRDEFAKHGCKLEQIFGSDQDDGYVCDCSNFVPQAFPEPT